MNEQAYKYKIYPIHAIEGYENSDINNKIPFEVESRVRNPVLIARELGNKTKIARMYVKELFFPFKTYSLDDSGNDFNLERLEDKERRKRKKLIQYEKNSLAEQSYRQHKKALSAKYMKLANGNENVAYELYEQDKDKREKERIRKQLERAKKKRILEHKKRMRYLAKRKAQKINATRRILLRNARNDSKAQKAIQRYIEHIEENHRLQRLLEIKMEINTGVYDNADYKIRAILKAKKLQLSIQEKRRNVKSIYIYRGK